MIWIDKGDNTNKRFSCEYFKLKSLVNGFTTIGGSYEMTDRIMAAFMFAYDKD